MFWQRPVMFWCESFRWSNLKCLILAVKIVGLVWRISIFTLLLMFNVTLHIYLFTFLKNSGNLYQVREEAGRDIAVVRNFYDFVASRTQSVHQFWLRENIYCQYVDIRLAGVKRKCWKIHFTLVVHICHTKRQLLILSDRLEKF